MKQNEIITDYYNKLWNSNIPNTIESVRSNLIFSAIQHHSIDMQNILEIGCGRGNLAALLAAQKKGDVVAVDLASVSQWKNLEDENENLHFISGNIMKISFSQKFNLIISSEVIEHFPYESQGKFIKLVNQLLTSKGYVIFTTPNSPISLKRLNDDNRQPIEAHLTSNQLRDLVIKENFNILEHSFFRSTYLDAGILHLICKKLHLLRLVYLPIIFPIINYIIKPSSSKIYQLIVLQKK